MYRSESDDLIYKKAKLLSNNISPLICWESFNERKSQNHFKIVKSQLRNFLKKLDDFDFKIIIAYEPVWAIGTGL